MSARIFVRMMLIGLAFTAWASTIRADCFEGSVLRFDGNDDCFAVPYDGSFPTEVFTLSAWVRIEADAPWGAVIARGEDDVTDNVVWSMGSTADGDLAVQLEDAGDVDFNYESQTPINDGAWHHLAASRSSTGTLTLYVDGGQVAQFGNTLVPSANNTQTLTIGCYLNNPLGPIGHLSGRIDDVTMWNRVLTAFEIEELHQRPPDPTDPGVLGFWPFDEGSGQTSSDASTHENDGTLGFDDLVGPDDPAWDTCGPPKDLDADGFHPPEDCDENDPAINPDASELPGNFVDENCDGSLGDCDPCFAWRNHGEYIRCVSHVVNDLVATGRITEEQGDALVVSAATSDVGKREFVPPECE